MTAWMPNRLWIAADDGGFGLKEQLGTFGQSIRRDLISSDKLRRLTRES